MAEGPKDPTEENTGKRFEDLIDEIYRPHEETEELNEEHDEEDESC